jgi:hypothetical protein
MAKGRLGEALYRLGRLDEDGEFVPEPVQCLPLKPEMKAVYYNGREPAIEWIVAARYFYVTGIMDSNEDVDPWWTVMVGYFSQEETIPMQDHKAAEMERLYNEQQ